MSHETIKQIIWVEALYLNRVVIPKELEKPVFQVI